MPKFSVVIAVYNKEAFIANTLQSVFDQTEQDFELLILNDGSTDNSEQAIAPFRKDPRVHYFSEPNQGAGAARNYLIKKATASLIALLDADDLWHSHHLETHSILQTAYPKESVFATNSELKHGDIITKRHFSIPTEGREHLITNFFEASLQDSIINSSTAVIKNEVFKKVGLYNPTITSGQDTDLFIRIGLAYSIAFHTSTTATILRNNSSLSNRSNVAQKAKFTEYEMEEQTNASLKKFLDLNRYSLCIEARLSKHEDVYRHHFQKIDLANLNKKQRFLIRQNLNVLNVMLGLKKIGKSLGLNLSSFR